MLACSVMGSDWKRGNEGMGLLGCSDCSSFQVSGKLGAIPEDTRH